jgi:hypothetical protein
MVKRVGAYLFFILYPKKVRVTGVELKREGD